MFIEVILLSLEMVTPVVARFEDPVRLSSEQKELLKTDGQNLNSLLKRTKKQISDEEKAYKQYKKYGTPPIMPRMYLAPTTTTASLESAITSAIDLTEDTREKFLKSSKTKGQEEFAGIFFAERKKAFETVQTTLAKDQYDYDKAKQETFSILAREAKVSEFLAQNDLATFDLEVKSQPQGADVSYRIDGVESHPRVGSTTIILKNLPFSGNITVDADCAGDSQSKSYDAVHDTRRYVEFTFDRSACRR